jgi:hypothetical protein
MVEVAPRRLDLYKSSIEIDMRDAVESLGGDVASGERVTRLGLGDSTVRDRPIVMSRSLLVVWEMIVGCGAQGRSHLEGVSTLRLGWSFSEISVLLKRGRVEISRTDVCAGSIVEHIVVERGSVIDTPEDGTEQRVDMSEGTGSRLSCILETETEDGTEESISQGSMLAKTSRAPLLAAEFGVLLWGMLSPIQY